MSSYVAQPQQQGQSQVQPVVVYPNPLSKQPGSEKSHHHSNGSFGTVFIVLAVIVVISAIACFLGRLCNRRVLNKAQKPSKHSHNHNNNHNNSNNGNNSISSSSRPKDQSRVHEFVKAKGSQGDIEFGSVSHQQTNNIVNNNNNVNTRPSKEAGDIEYGFDMRSSSSAPSNGKPSNGIHGNSTSNNNNNNNNSMRYGSRGHVAFERSGDHSKHQGGVGRYYDYHGGPRASE